MNLRLVLPAALLIAAAPAFGQAAPADISSLVEAVRQQHNLPALGGAIVTRDGLSAIGVSGVRRWGDPTPVSIDDKWHLGSNTKAITALLAATAVQAGRLSWSDPLLDRYPELAPHAHPEFANLTLSDLATMRSGIAGNPGFLPSGSRAEQRLAVDRWAISRPPAAPRGSFYYSNISFQMLGEVAARAWGTSYEEALKKQLWAPLGITNVGLGPTTAVGATDQPVAHYPRVGGWAPCEACDIPEGTGSGTIHMSLPDWGRLTQEVLRMHVGQSKLLGQAEARLLTTGVTAINATVSYAYGWNRHANPTESIVSHSGSDGRNLSRAVLFLDAGAGFLATTNSGDPTPGGGAPNAAVTALVARMRSYHQTGQ
ncbi:MAG TPA: serine hydrolase domain-containing protein [Deinococcales bacterium]|nr:serine hydrolase domain-containing protein [Deinococcales bacterium]